MKIYKTKTNKLPGTRYADVYKKAFAVYKQIKKKTKRRPYVRSAYFNKDKIFLDLFWRHLHEKENLRDKTRRVKYFLCAIELIRNSRFEPISKENPNKRFEIVHRFAGATAENDLFIFANQRRKTHRTKMVNVSISRTIEIKKGISTSLWCINHGQKPFSIIIIITYLKNRVNNFSCGKLKINIFYIVFKKFNFMDFITFNFITPS